MFAKMGDFLRYRLDRQGALRRRKAAAQGAKARGFVGREKIVHLSRAAEFVLAPRNVWHTARTSIPTTMLFITPGEGTEHLPCDSMQNLAHQRLFKQRMHLLRLHIAQGAHGERHDNGAGQAVRRLRAVAGHHPVA